MQLDYHNPRHNLIDLTLDDDDSQYLAYQESPRKRLRTDSSPGFILNAGDSSSSSTPSFQTPSPALPEVHISPVPHISQVFQDPNGGFLSSSQLNSVLNFTGPSHSSAFYPHRSESTPTFVQSTILSNNPSTSSVQCSRQIIDLTSSPSPPPAAGSNVQRQSQSASPGALPHDLSPTTPICIGQVTVTALILYPIGYLQSSAKQLEDDIVSEAEWAPVKLHYDQTAKQKNPNSHDTIHIRTPQYKTMSGEILGGENFAVVEQKVASVLGLMIGRGLIRAEANIRRGSPKLPILPLQVLIFTPKGNIPAVSGHLQQNGLLLDHPSQVSSSSHNSIGFYMNPHNPPPGGHIRNFFNPRWNASTSRESRWSAPSVPGKSVEVHRNQVEEVFKSLRSGDELEETEPNAYIATRLYPHQKKALTFLLEREREIRRADGKASSLWQMKSDTRSNSCSWVNLITKREVFSEPSESKSALLADDMGLGKTVTCVSLIAHTLVSARSFASQPLQPFSKPSSNQLSHDDSSSQLDAQHFAGSVWNMPMRFNVGEVTKEKLSSKQQEKANLELLRQQRVRVRSKATLIICPLSTVVNWEEQFKEHWAGEVSVTGGAGVSVSINVSQQSLPSLWSHKQNQFMQGGCTKDEAVSEGSLHGSPLKVYIYHGNARRPDPHFLADFDAVITTYSTLATEYSRQSRSAVTANSIEEYTDGNSLLDKSASGYSIQAKSISAPGTSKGSKRKKGFSQLSGAAEVSSPLQSVHWFRVVLDEAHSIKETSTVGSRAACDLMADRRLCLTGTPVQNKLDDVYALIRFLRLEPFDERAVWQEFIGVPVKFGQTLGVARLQTIMKCITLRRTKDSRTENGQRILSLPPRRDELRLLKFDEKEQTIYNQFYNESKAEFTELSDKNEVMRNYVGILQKILRLRQICDHYELVEGKGPVEYGDHGELSAAIAREGLNPSRAQAIFKLLRDSGTAQCVECGGDLSHILDASSSENLDVCDEGPSLAKRGKKGKSTASTRQNSPVSSKAVLSRCQHLYCIECLQTSVFPYWPNVSADLSKICSACQIVLSPLDLLEIDCSAIFSPLPSLKKCRKEKTKKAVNLDSFHPSTKVKALLGDLVTFSRANPHSANYDPSSIEVQVVDESGNNVDEGVVKTVVFSQWTSMLDKVEEALGVAGIRYDRLDGTMTREDRTRAMEALKTDKSCEVLLVSLKAGGVGLNLTAAQRVYLMDPYWNPAVENQAVDRIHRLGQTRPVTTVRLIIENSIEARLLEVQRKKTALANMTLGQHLSKSELLHRRMEELNQLFG